MVFLFMSLESDPARGVLIRRSQQRMLLLFLEEGGEETAADGRAIEILPALGFAYSHHPEAFASSLAVLRCPYRQH